jgi:hypothetical protein
MELRHRVLSLTLLALLPATAWAGSQAESSSRPLRLELDATHVERPTRIARAAARRTPDAVPAPSVGRRAVASLLEASEAPAPANAPAGPEASPFKFERQGHAGRDVARAYRNMTERVSAKVWDEPNGKRIKFDVAGKPGIGVEIPIR